MYLGTHLQGLSITSQAFYKRLQVLPVTLHFDGQVVSDIEEEMAELASDTESDPSDAPEEVGIDPIFSSCATTHKFVAVNLLGCFIIHNLLSQLLQAWHVATCQAPLFHMLALMLGRIYTGSLSSLSGKGRRCAACPSLSCPCCINKLVC